MLRMATGAGLIAAAILAWSGAAAAGTLDVSVRNGFVSLNAHAVPLGDVLREMSKQSGFKLVMKKEPAALVTWKFREVPLDQAVSRLLSSVSSIALYAPGGDGTGSVLTEVRVLRGGQKSSPLVEHSSQLAAGGDPFEAAGSAEIRPRRAGVSQLASAGVSDIQPASRQVRDIDPALEDGDPAKRRDRALNAAKRRPDMARDALTEALADPDIVVRQRAVQGLARLGGEETVSALSHVLLEDPAPKVRRMAAAGLGRVSTESAFWALMEANSDADPAVREAVSAALVALEQRGIGARSEATAQ